VGRCCGLECYSYVGVFKYICNFPYLWAVIGERGPNLIVFLPVLRVINSALYLVFKFVE
jgi:hypothetical protein